MHIVRSRGLEGDHGTWDEFMKSKHPADIYIYIYCFFCFSYYKLGFLIPAVFWLVYSQIGLLALFMKAWQILVKTTLSREDYPLDYFLSPPFEDWVVTGIGRNKSGSGYFENIDRCNFSLLRDGSFSR
uniref:Uncharacterized protein n=1 Tax=Brassica oleracea TaxID=3712 RepID=A0A3P6E9U4_BRAOL|nr:unnamed protein product [Brassica oleracea]